MNVDKSEMHMVKMVTNRAGHVGLANSETKALNTKLSGREEKKENELAKGTENYLFWKYLC